MHAARRSSGPVLAPKIAKNATTAAAHKANPQT
jgi:hypothetical protein